MDSHDAKSIASCDSYDPLSPFTKVMATLRTDAIPEVALEIRRKASPCSARMNQLTCLATKSPITGAFNIVYEVQFSDGIQWMLKVPKTGHAQSWDASAANCLTAEAFTMKFIKKHTQIPVPTVYDFNAHLENRLNAPYILMEKIQGVSLSEFWYDRNFSREERRSRNSRILKELASAMVQMNSFTFDKGGSPLFDTEDRISGIGSWRQKDFNDEFASIIEARGVDEDYAEVFQDHGPFDDPREQFKWSFRGRRSTLPSNDSFMEGQERLLELFVSWIPDVDAPNLQPGPFHDLAGQHQPFVLSHPDFDVQNIIVTYDGHLAGFIDWDCVTTVGRILGNERYPLWLTKDWNPWLYHYDAAKDQIRPHQHGANDQCCPSADSPEDMEFYRQVYQEIIAELSKEIFGAWGPDRLNAIGVDLEEASKRLCRLTRNSLVATTLESACMSRIGFPEIMDFIWERIVEVVGDDADTDSLTNTGEGSGEFRSSPAFSSSSLVVLPKSQNPPELVVGVNAAAADQRKEADNQEGSAVIESKRCYLTGISEDVEHEEKAEREVKHRVDESKVSSGGTRSPISPHEDDFDEAGADTPAIWEERDYGNFMLYDVALGLVNGTLDEHRYNKLKKGFISLFR